MYALYQNLPALIDPIAVRFGMIEIYWYSLMWLCAFMVVYLLLIFRIKRREGAYSNMFIQDVMINAFFGALIGGRLGYVFFYDLQYYVAHPLSIISPYDFVLQEWTGIYGMSFHGGVLGVICALFITAKKTRKDFLDLTDFIVPAIPMGYFFGRIGNFLNQELVGRATSSRLGMYFNEEATLRHPSQLYEAVGEGLLLFFVLWMMRNRVRRRGVLSGIFLIGYAMIRGSIEFFREPDAHIGFIGGILTMGQILSSCMFFCGIFLLIYAYKKKK